MIDVVITCGDVNGIGPEISLKAISELASNEDYRFIFITPENVLEKDFGVSTNFVKVNNKDEIDELNSHVIVPLDDVTIEYGKPTVESGRTSFLAMQTALDYINKHRMNSILVTAPIAKNALKMAGVDFPGHTEMLANYFQVENYVMMFLSDKWNCALSTIHIPLMEVPVQIRNMNLPALFKTCVDTCIIDLNIPEPNISVLGLNPHAGENGNIGKEEIETITPAINGMSKFVSGPFVPDAYFAAGLHLEYDLTIGMYHDQVLIPFKMDNGKFGVNYTAGLPVVRTSPDHGTAFDIAGKGIADPASMVAAIEWGSKILNNRKINCG